MRKKNELINCSKCNNDMSIKDKKCPHCGEINTSTKKRTNIILLFIKMVFLFTIIDLFVTIIPIYLSKSVFNFKYGEDFIVESLWCLCIVIVLLLSGNSYVFTEKKEKFFKSVFLGLPMLLIGGISLLVNVLANLGEIHLGNLANLILFTASIGLTEEFLCRGWIQNEFIERYGDTRKKVIISIILSSLVFGVMHITNILAGQTVIETIMQIIQATALGVLLGSVYYRTKNIWAVAFLHGFYDFSLMLGDISLIKDCTTGTANTSIILYQAFSSLIFVAIYLLYSMIILRKRDTHKLIDENSELTDEELKKDQKYVNNVQIGICISIALFFIPIGNNIEGYDEYQICYTYNEKSINGYETHFSNYSIYELYYDENKVENNDNNTWENNKLENKYVFELYYDNEEEKLAIKNTVNEEKVYIENEYVYDYIVIYNEGFYTIMYYDNKEIKVYYSKIKETDLNDSKEFLDNLKNSFKAYDVPDIKSLGYLTYTDSDDNYYTYAYMVSDLGYEFIIDEYEELYLLK